MLIKENEKVKAVSSNFYNYIFKKENGTFLRWGKSLNDDPIMAPLPEILDLEISQGKCSGKCPECYKCNGDVNKTINLSFKDFRKIFHNVANTVLEVKYKNQEPYFNSLFHMLEIDNFYDDCLTKNDFIKRFCLNIDKEIEYIKIYNKGMLTQIAFGICDLDTNPDFLKMMKYCREFDVIPNFTFNGNGLTNELAEEISKVAGAVAISNHKNTYDCVKTLTDKGMKQINIHFIVHDKSYDSIFKLIDDIKTDSRLEKLNALVLLRYKPKGNNRDKFKQITLEQYKNIINYSIQKGVSIGFDSCSAPLYLQVVKDNPELKKTEIFVEPCESSLFSSYINCKGEFYACSFCEGEGMWKTGINVLNQDFKDVWNNTQANKFREKLLKNNRRCPMFGGLK